jgi:hypothetical protein
MNKKTYNKPEMKMVFLSHRGSLLAYSLGGTGDSGGTGQIPTPVPANPPKTRRFDWDDEE